VATFIALVGQAMPLYWFGIMLIIVFGVWLGWLPISGSDTPAHLVLPAITLGSWILPINMRLVRSGMLEVLNQDYIRTARAKGLTERKVMVKHAFKNAAIPVLTVAGMQFGALLGGSVVTETVFAWPGIGRLAVDSIRMGDYPVVQTIVVIFSMVIVLANLAADLLAALIDPRIRLD
jgi:ABC-type dipeptide/oligopeptide/nickel transport system permease component